MKDKLEYHYRAFDRSQLSPDPLEYPHRFNNPEEIELAAFIASVFAYGNVRQIGRGLNEILNIMAGEPLRYLTASREEKIRDDFGGLKHRFYTPEDIAALFVALGDMYKDGLSVGWLFGKCYEAVGGELKGGIGGFHKFFLERIGQKGEVTPGIRFMFPQPERGSACKRINLFLRWMVRKDELDFGLWDFISPSELIIPVDTHIARIARELKLTKLKNVSWKMAEEITDNLRQYDKNDPVKYDFALCHIGIRKKEF
ncbi:MAG: TIGR02757 family protein [Ignavibacteriaceae bacterium]